MEASVRSCPGVKQAAVIVHSPQHGERELIGFVVMKFGDARDGSHVRSHVLGQLPAYTVPSAIMTLAEIPHTANGKIDRAALIEIRKHARQMKARTPARTPTEELLVELWKKVLEVEQVGTDDNFFELGGNSLLAMQLTGQLATRFGVSLRVLAVFEHSTVASMAQLVDASAQPDPWTERRCGGLEEGVI